MDHEAAEIYLRCRLEDALMGDAHEASPDLTARVQAVLAVGLIDDRIAERVLADATSALSARDEDEHPHDMSDEDDDEDDHVAARVAVCPTVIACDWGTLVVTHLVLDARHSTMGARGMKSTPSSPLGHHFFDEPWTTVEVIDPSGVKYKGHYTGGSSDTSFDGEFHFEPAIPGDAAWIMIAGTRIELDDQAAPLPVRVRTTDELSLDDRAVRHLRLLRWQRHHFEEGDRAAALATFEDLGMDVSDRPDAAPGRSSRGGKRRRHARRDHGSPPRLVALGTTTPVVDGITLNLSTLSDAGELGYSGRSAGLVVGDSSHPAMRMSAVDDLGTSYDFATGSSGSSDSTFHGTVRLEPGLDPDAKVLTIAVDTLRHRLEVDVPLAWPEP